MLLVNARVGPSSIHGLGLIAQENIPKGTMVWKLAPGFDVLLTDSDFSALPDVAQAVVLHYGHYDNSLKCHVLSVDDDRFTNHSDSANVRFYGDHAIAVEDIAMGEEITDNYTEYGKPLNRL